MSPCQGPYSRVRVKGFCTAAFGSQPSLAMEARSWVWLPLVPEEPKVELEVFDDTVAVDVVRDDVVLDPEKESAEREAAAAAKALKTWTGKKGCVRRFLTAERAAAAGLDWTDYFDEDGSPFIESNTISKAVRRAERAADAEEARCIKESEARRKRVRRIEEGIEDRDALRQLASSRNDGTILELEATARPACARLRWMARHAAPRRRAPRCAHSRRRSMSGCWTRASTTSSTMSSSGCKSQPSFGTLPRTDAIRTGRWVCGL